MRILITGGTGFIGSAVTRWIIEKTPHLVLVFDYAGSLASLTPITYDSRYSFRKGDIADRPGHDLRYAIDASRIKSNSAGSRDTISNMACAGPSLGISTTAIGGRRSVRAFIAASSSFGRSNKGVS